MLPGSCRVVVIGLFGWGPWLGVDDDDDYNDSGHSIISEEAGVTVDE